MTSRFSPTTVVEAKADVASCALGEGCALLDLERSQYFSMNAVAADLWDRMRQPVPVDALVAHIRETFETGDADVARDIEIVLTELERLDLIHVVPD